MFSAEMAKVHLDLTRLRAERSRDMRYAISTLRLGFWRYFRTLEKFTAFANSQGRHGGRSPQENPRWTACDPASMKCRRCFYTRGPAGYIPCVRPLGIHLLASARLSRDIRITTPAV